MTVVRDVEPDVSWDKVRDEIDKGLDDFGFRIELQTDPVDPETWGLSPAAIEAQEHAMRMGGGVDGSGAPPPG